MKPVGYPTIFPEHMAFIMDGNGRWAEKKERPRFKGHQAGMENTIVLIKQCAALPIKILTLFAFSTENWKRPKKELDELMILLTKAFHEKLHVLIKLNIQLQVIGDIHRFDTALQRKIEIATQSTKENTGLIVVIAVSYGGHWDILSAVKKTVLQVIKGTLTVQDISTSQFESQLQLAGLPAPDFCIRTGGEYRLSNFLLWHLAYSELYFTNTLWPNFNEHELQQALHCYARRHRRFGQLKKKNV